MYTNYKYLQKKYSKANQYSTLALRILVLLLAISTSSSVHGAYLFLGTGNDGYFADASGVWNNLQGQQGWEDAQHRLWPNRTGNQMQSDISWLQQAGPGDVAIWYYSGHGGSSTYDGNRDESIGDLYDETIGLQNNGTWAIDDEIASALSQISSSVPIVAIMDTCYAGGFIDGTSDLNRLPNLVALLSCEADQSSYSLVGDPFSLFTTGLIAGLGPGMPADLDSDGMLWSDEWFSYAVQHMPTLPTGYEQDPVYWAASGLDRVMIVPEPAMIVILLIGTVGVFKRR